MRRLGPYGVARDADPPDEHLAKSARLLAWTTRSLECACVRSGTSLAKYRVLFLLAEGSLRSADLAVLARVGAPTVTALTDGLARAGLLDRVPSRSDRRGVRLRITEAGLAALAQTERALAAELAALLRRLTDGYPMDGVAAIYDRVAAQCRASCAHGALDAVDPVEAIALDPIPDSFDERSASD